MGFLDAVSQETFDTEIMHPYMSQNPQSPMNLGYTAWQLELSHVHTYLCISELEDKECVCIWDNTRLGAKHTDTLGWN